MAPLVLDLADFRDRVHACWLGKSIGGTLGTPHEGKRYALDLTFYDPVPATALPNDDLDLQLVWLAAMEEAGTTDPSVAQLTSAWTRWANAYPWNEYGFFMRNHARGLRPPVAGCFENYYVDEMGSPIRSEIWAVLHAGDPQAAARMAWKDSVLDHAGGEGVWGEMFWAAVQAAAFVERDPQVLIRIGLNMIPLASHLGRCIREAVWCHATGLSYEQARARITERFAGIQPCNAVPNHGFTIVGWLYGADFGDQLLKAVNCGWDTDCTCASAGAVLGALGGPAAFAQRWTAPIGDGVWLGPGMIGLSDPPRTLGQLSERSLRLSQRRADAPLAVPAQRGVERGALRGTIALHPLDGSPAVPWANGELPAQVKAAGGATWDWGAGAGGRHHIVCLADAGAQLSLDGGIIVDCPAGLPYVPAVHRCPGGSRASLSAGTGVKRLQLRLGSRDPRQRASAILAEGNMDLAPWTGEALPAPGRLRPV